MGIYGDLMVKILVPCLSGEIQMPEAKGNHETFWRTDEIEATTRVTWSPDFTMVAVKSTWEVHHTSLRWTWEITHHRMTLTQSGARVSTDIIYMCIYIYIQMYMCFQHAATQCKHWKRRPRSFWLDCDDGKASAIPQIHCFSPDPHHHHHHHLSFLAN